MDKRYLKLKSLTSHIFSCLIMAVALCVYVSPAFAADSSAEKINFSPAYISLSDAIGETKSGEVKAARIDLNELGSYLNGLNISDTTNKKLVTDALEKAVQTPSVENLTAISSALITLEKYVNPVDYATLRKQFIKRVMPTYDAMARAVANKDMATLQTSFRTFNQAWAKRERVVHETSMGHYGKMETALTLLNVAKARTNPSWDEITLQSTIIGETLDSFNKGETIATTNSDMDLSEGITLLNSALSDYQQQNSQSGNDNLMRFIKSWPVFESEVSTRSPRLYTQVESELPLIIAADGNSQSQESLGKLITELSALNPAANYTAIDAALILLREGLEALLIIIALFSAMKVAEQKRGQRWVVGGAAMGLVTSLFLAWALVRFLPSNLAGSTREMLEGTVGLVAVVMMLLVGAWLHSKSSAVSWKKFLHHHSSNAVNAGSFLSLATLSFLAVFREGAETVLFYAGILPKIELSQFFLGIIIALVVLVVVAFIILKTSVKLPIPMMFKLFTWLIYFLGFKMLGVSVHALQLTGHIDIHVLSNLPTISFIGFYPTIETVAAHLVYIVVVLGSLGWQRRQLNNDTATSALPSSG